MERRRGWRGYFDQRPKAMASDGVEVGTAASLAQALHDATLFSEK
jgi:hypothetical protein